jgi:hypothetical protein
MQLLATSRLVLLLCVAQLTACATNNDHGLMDQIANWEGEATVRCGGQVRIEDRTPEMTDRC